MRQPAKRALVRRWPLIAACVLVFLFAFHAKTAMYKEGLAGKPHTGTSSKMWVKHQRIPKPSFITSFIAKSPSIHYRNFTWGLLFLKLEIASGFVPVPCFSGLSPPPFVQERQ
jgi:hypothetical protein